MIVVILSYEALDLRHGVIPGVSQGFALATEISDASKYGWR